MLFPVMLFLLVLSPLFIPMAVTVAHQIGNCARISLLARSARFSSSAGRRPGASRRLDPRQQTQKARHAECSGPFCVCSR